MNRYNLVTGWKKVLCVSVTDPSRVLQHVWHYALVYTIHSGNHYYAYTGCIEDITACRKWHSSFSALMSHRDKQYVTSTIYMQPYFPLPQLGNDYINIYTR